MNTLHIPLSLSLLLSFTAPLMSADQNQKIGWSGYRPKNPIIYTPQPPQPISEEHPATYCLLRAEINRTSVESLLERARAKGRKEGHTELRGANDYGMPFVLTIPSLLVLKNTFNSTMTDPLAQKILKLANVEQFNHDNELSSIELDQFTHCSAQKENGVCTVECTTNIDNISTIERIIFAIKKEANQ